MEGYELGNKTKRLVVGATVSGQIDNTWLQQIVARVAQSYSFRSPF